ncbi:hypothetical protein, conserved [Babesia bigemina]|uniref:C3H1-type domain-containing protein n=1 Tax=Babesia bigemina TaxID=5866 RepID=A0A061BKG2_BABBI|nr:hypothetical protein, conserved [Babesia bigemina]CDR71413.1 hypothetical protein, conserved [Babesia bigemina]|eukprot:XP_012770363.1 hypothetical protein, conserved [Babesia bigemina]
MGFLSGVLSNIKDHLGQHNNEISNAIKSLETCKHGGKLGFNDAIGRVVEGVRGYNERVKNSNDSVKSKITDLDSQMKKLKQSVSEDLKNNFAAGAGRIVQGSVDSADQLVKTCLNNADKFNESLDTAKYENVKNAINDLNSIVRDDVNKARACVKLETEQFAALSSKQQEDRKVMREKIERCLTDLGTCVNDSIKKKVKNLVDDLSKKVNEIKRQLEEIKKQLMEYIGELTTWIGQAEPLINSAFGKVEEILKEVNEGDSEKKPFLIASAVREITASVLILHGAGEEAKKHVKEKVTAALKQVKEMNDELKKDLYKVKGAIKKAIWDHVNENIVTTHFNNLEKNVREGLWKIESAIKTPLESTVEKSSFFFEKFEDTKNAIEEAVKNVEGNLQNLEAFKNIESIGSGVEGNVQLLSSLTRAPFTQLKTYFTHLNQDIMIPLKNIMQNRGWQEIIRYADARYVNHNIKDVKDELSKHLTTLQSAVKGSNPGLKFQEVEAQLKSTVGDMFNVKNNIQEKLGSVIELQGMINKLQQSPPTLEQGDAAKIFTALGQIAEGVAEHYKEVVEATIDAITKKLESEVKGVTAAIRKKVSAIYSGIKDANDEEKKIEYSAGSLHEKARGLLTLVNSYKMNVKAELEKLKTETIPQAFKKKSLSGPDSKDYNFGSGIMDDFIRTHAELNTELQASKFQAAVAEKLNTEIGRDALIQGGGVGGKIAEFLKDKYPNYTGQINQDTLELLKTKPDELKGDLPEKIIDIKTQVENALIKIDSEKEYAVKELEKITATLHELCQAVRAAGDHAQGSLKQLQDTYFNTSEYAKNGIRIIQYQLTNLQEDDLAKAIKEATKFLHEAEKIRDDTTRSLKIDVDGQVKEVKRQLTSELDKQYITTMALQLDHFADRVTAHLKGLPEAIEQDKNTGFKGFMEAFEGKPEVKPREKYAFEAPTVELSKLEEFKGAVTKPHNSKKDEFKTLSEEFKKLYINLHLYVNKETVRVNDEENSKKHPAGTDIHDYQRRLLAMYDRFNELMLHIANANRYDHQIPGLLDGLLEALHDLKPDGFAKPSTPVIDCVSSGLTNFIGELSRVYISAYDRQKFGELVKNPNTEYSVLTKEGRDCAKTFLTLLAILNDDLSYFRDQCNSEWSKRKLYSGSSLGSFLRRCGYRVAIKETDQNGELQNKTGFTGSSIYGKLVGENYDHVYRNDKDTKFALENMYAYLTLYYDVCHIAASLSTRRPCSIYEMLGWFTSLVHHPVYFELTTNDFADLFDKPKKKAGGNAAVDGITFEEPSSLLLNAYPQNLTPSDLHDAVMHVTSLAPVILTTIVGYGDEFTTYAVDYHSNAAGFAIPSSPSSCLNMLLELMRRLFPVFRFLHSRCSNLASEYGWYHCAYGSDVESAGWQCKDHSKTDVECRPRSPLMSYLRDSLPGHLPHQLTSVDCKSECKTCPKLTPGMPCITPLGFKGFSGSKRTGKDISNVLIKFFDKGVASCLLSLSPRPPSSLPEHYAFALSFVKGWSFGSSNGLKQKIESTMKTASIDLYSDASPLTNALTQAYGDARSSHGTNHPKSSEDAVSSLSISTRCNGANHCGPYLSTLYSDTYPYFGNKHCDAYMSWSVYLPWTFWQQLNSLYNAFLQIFCQDWGCTGCLRGDTCKKGTHGMLNPDVPGDGCKCPSIVGCKGVGPTLYQYGFTFQDVHCLISNQTKCFNLRNQLFSVLHSQYFKDLFEKCDEFLWIIRQPFSYLVLALWLLSLLYLIHIMVIRLDLLHIKSHLHSPSSHRIAAQSLLAAARVNKLNRVFYLQP